MQTFLPYEDYTESVRILDTKRLGNQRNEAYIILRNVLSLEDEWVTTGQVDWRKRKGWERHPATKMWVGYSAALYNYLILVCREWGRRGFVDTVRHKTDDLMQRERKWRWGLFTRYPDFGPNFHLSHRNTLFLKDPTHYGRFGGFREWVIRPQPIPRIPYVWPPFRPPAPYRAERILPGDEVGA